MGSPRNTLSATAASRRALALLLGAIAVEAVIGLSLRLDVLSGTLLGDQGADDLFAAFGLGWLVVLGLAAARAWSATAALRNTVADRDASLHALATTSHDWLWHATPDLVATFCSAGTAEILGYQPEEIVGRSFLEFLVPQDRLVATEILATSIARGGGWNDIELRWAHRDGHVIKLEGSAVPVLDTAGRVIGFHGARRFSPSATPAHREHAAASARVSALLEDERLDMALQPIIDLGTGTWTGVEALARFPDGRGPDIWFAEAHGVGLGIDLELLAVRKALEVIPDLPEHVTLSINASPAMILDPRLRELLERVTCPLARITLEITEHAAVVGYTEMKAALLPLRERGVQLAVDDTGAGYASFSHVLKLRPDVIKLDRSLVANIDGDAACRTLVTAIVLLALEMGASITAEGVETLPELNVLMLLGVDTGQGYFLARPAVDASTWVTWRTRCWIPTASAVVPRELGAGLPR